MLLLRVTALFAPVLATLLAPLKLIVPPLLLDTVMPVQPLLQVRIPDRSIAPPVRLVMLAILPAVLFIVPPKVTLPLLPFTRKASLAEELTMSPRVMVTGSDSASRLIPRLVLLVEDTSAKVQPVPKSVLLTSMPGPPLALIMLLVPPMLTVPLLLATRPAPSAGGHGQTVKGKTGATICSQIDPSPAAAEADIAKGKDGGSNRILNIYACDCPRNANVRAGVIQDAQ